MSNEEMQLRIIEEIISANGEILIALYEIIVNCDFDYIQDLFYSIEEFEEFIEKWRPTKCCIKEEDND